MNCHYLDLSTGKWTVRILVFVDSSLEKQSNKAIKEVKSEEFQISLSYYTVVVIGVKDVQQLGKGSKASRNCFIALQHASEGIKDDELIKIVSGSIIERLTRFEIRNFIHSTSESMCQQITAHRWLAHSAPEVRISERLLKLNHTRAAPQYPR